MFLPLPPRNPAYLLLPDEGGASLRLTDVRGRSIPRRSVELRPLYRDGDGLYRMGSGLRLKISPADALTPLIEDDRTAKLRARWATRPL